MTKTQTQTVTKLKNSICVKNSNCDETQFFMKLKNANCDKTQTQTQIVSKTQSEEKTQKLKL